MGFATQDLPFKVVETMAEYAAVVSLRYEVLRKDWKQPFQSATDAFDQDPNTYTLAAFHPKTGEALATARLQSYKLEGWAQVRYVAVQKALQGQGLGTAAMLAIHKKAIDVGYSHIYLEARDTALDMYKKLGYEVKYFLDLRLGLIPHYVCEIALTK